MYSLHCTLYTVEYRWDREVVTPYLQGPRPGQQGTGHRGAGRGITKYGPEITKPKYNDVILPINVLIHPR